MGGSGLSFNVETKKQKNSRAFTFYVQPFVMTLARGEWLAKFAGTTVRTSPQALGDKMPSWFCKARLKNGSCVCQ